MKRIGLLWSLKNLILMKLILIKGILEIKIFLKWNKSWKKMDMRKFILEMIFKSQRLKMKNFLIFLMENMNGWKKISNLG